MITVPGLKNSSSDRNPVAEAGKYPMLVTSCIVKQDKNGNPGMLVFSEICDGEWEGRVRCMLWFSLPYEGKPTSRQEDDIRKFKRFICKCGHESGIQEDGSFDESVLIHSKFLGVLGVSTKGTEKENYIQDYEFLIDS